MRRYLALTCLAVSCLFIFSGCSSLFGSEGRWRVPAGKAPWMVMLVGPTEQGEYICSGTLVAPTWVLTASHCVEQQRPIVIGRSGEVVRARTSYEHPSAVATDWEGSINPLKKSPTDLALVQLPETLQGSAPIKLPTKQAPIPTSGTLWGYGPELSPVGRLYWTESRIRKCSRGGAALLCLGDNQGRFRACQGDSGGPVISGRGPNKTIWGVNSFALIIPLDGCTLPRGESFYAGNVQAHLNWIKSIVGDR